ncbi:glutathione S-transferase family protein [Pseudomonas cannabina]|uniref:Glutathione S-transferase protein n=3 Tax=Pseudomonas syringae group TaxID=136849 RepID=A0A3M3RE45_PSECA|nr:MULTISPECIES: glutathione S-transferase [Pseudomonas syringae group]KPB77438.1 Glutathione S-transferase [Pseudomonas syringae pv. maculicola]KPW25688.1 Glutathione S-transferase family protein [Pseudomonas cannabina pv. alisalensis]MBM0140071.1 glutathione S-transferase [Pseudomonas cannabina pv. alisalensis]QHE97194.1 glutathione S-transferase [Pseudomonas syringae pv. maculicola str. ES4326]QQN19726.1 glutathione S-transferase [Pseudomonas cannabina pv. alisalensis]
MLRILGKSSSINVRKVLWACEELRIPFQQEDWGSGFNPTDTAEFLALNQNAMVPVIVDDGFVLWESNSIIRYLAARHDTGGTLYPYDPKKRARIDQWIDWQSADLNRSWAYAFMALTRRAADFNDPVAIAASCANWARHMQILDRQLEMTGAYVSGESFSLADIPIGLSVNRWFETPMDHPELLAVNAYYQRLSNRPGYLLHGRNGTP